MNLPLCFSSLGCPQLDVEGLCQLANRFGIPRLEIRVAKGIVDFPGYLADHPDELAAARETLAQHGVKLALIASSFNLTQSAESDIEGLLKACLVADTLGAPWVRIFGGGRFDAKMTEEELTRAAKLYELAFDRVQAAGHRAQLLVETHGGFVDSSAIRTFEQHATREVLYLWDTHHTWKLGGESLAETCALIAPRVRHLHTKDSVPSAEGGKAAHHVLPGAGTFPWAELRELTSQFGPETSFSLEWEKQWHPEMEPLEEALGPFKTVAVG